MPTTITEIRFLAVALAAASAGLLIAADSPTGGEPGTHTFVVSNLFPASAGEADKCSMIAPGDLERFYSMLSPEDQAKFAAADKPREIDPAKRARLELLMNEQMKFRRLSLRGERGKSVILPPGVTRQTKITPEIALEIGRLNGFSEGRGRPAFGNTEVVYSACSNPLDFPALAEGHQLYDGKVAAGINLDGKASKEDFTGTDGKPGVDNQLWRAIGCVKPFREASNEETAHKTLISATAPTLIEISGVDNLMNDPEVVVKVRAATDQLTRDGRGTALARATYATDPDPRLNSMVRGKIINGVLETQPFDLTINYKEQIVDAPRIFRSARLRATLKKDGTIDGRLFGYYTLASYYASIEQMTQNGVNTTGVSCPGVHKAINQLADGHRDPKTGRFTSISSAFSFVGVRAFAAPPALTRDAGSR